MKSSATAAPAAWNSLGVACMAKTTPTATKSFANWGQAKSNAQKLRNEGEISKPDFDAIKSKASDKKPVRKASK